MSIDRYTYPNDAPELLELLKNEKERLGIKSAPSTTEPKDTSYDLPKTRISTVPARLNSKPVETIISAYFCDNQVQDGPPSTTNTSVVLPYSGTESEKDLPAVVPKPDEYWANMIP